MAFGFLGNIGGAMAGGFKGMKNKMSAAQGLNAGPSGSFMNRFKTGMPGAINALGQRFGGNTFGNTSKITGAMTGGAKGRGAAPQASNSPNQTPPPAPGPVDTAPQFQFGGNPAMSRWAQMGGNTGISGGMFNRPRIGGMPWGGGLFGSGNTGISGGMFGGSPWGSNMGDMYQTQGGPASDFMPGGRFGGGGVGSGGLWNIYNRNLESGVPENPQIYY